MYKLRLVWQKRKPSGASVYRELKYMQASARYCEIQAGGKPGLEQALRDEEAARADYIRVLEKLTGLLRGI